MMSNQELLDNEMGSPPSVVDVEKVIAHQRRRVRYRRVGAAGVLAASAVALALVVSALPNSGAATHARVGAKPKPTATVSPNLVTESDAEALLGGFLIACEDPATYALAGQGVPCAKVERGRIYDVDGHYCADDWHLVSSQLVDTKANLEKYRPLQSIDGVILKTTRTPIRLIDPTYSQQHFGGQYYYIQIGVILSPQQISAGKHSLRQFTANHSFDRQIPFTIDRSGTGVCAGS
ncbi:MAG TPA: hypothetical protein VKB59_20055 [Micromonosporaceae bacterium]|nr:hypothetical protein [Micromonosporaceae bacterium]